MPRLFTSDKDIAFFNDITKEITKDVIGQKILYYSVNLTKTKVHDLYSESPDKIYDDPIEIEVLASSPQVNTKYDRFGADTEYTLELYIQWQDLVARGINVVIGDFFQYGENFYEIQQANILKAMNGLIEHKDGVKVLAKKARRTQFKERLLGPTDISRSEPDAIQETFVQQRGNAVFWTNPCLERKKSLSVVIKTAQDRRSTAMIDRVYLSI